MSIWGFFPLISQPPPIFLLKTVFLVLYLEFFLPLRFKSAVILCLLVVVCHSGFAVAVLWAYHAYFLCGHGQPECKVVVLIVCIFQWPLCEFVEQITVFPSAGSFSPGNDMFQYGLKITLYVEKLRVTFLKAYYSNYPFHLQECSSLCYQNAKVVNAAGEHDVNKLFSKAVCFSTSYWHMKFMECFRMLFCVKWD